MEIKTVKANEIGNLVQQHMLLIVDYFADWCQPCKSLHAILLKIAEEYKVPNETINIVRVDVNDEANIGDLDEISNVPLTRIYGDGEPLAEIPGYSKELVVVLKKYCEQAKARAEKVSQGTPVQKQDKILVSQQDLKDFKEQTEGNINKLVNSVEKLITDKKENEERRKLYWFGWKYTFVNIITALVCSVITGLAGLVAVNRIPDEGKYPVIMAIGLGMFFTFIIIRDTLRDTREVVRIEEFYAEDDDDDDDDDNEEDEE